MAAVINGSGQLFEEYREIGENLFEDDGSQTSIRAVGYSMVLLPPMVPSTLMTEHG